MQQTFQDAIKESGEILDSIKSGRTSLADALPDLKRLLSTEESARGFFVALLTGEYDIAEKPPAPLLEAISGSGNACHVVLAKNLVMSTNMSVVHERNGDTAAADGSRTVAGRAAAIIKAIGTDDIKQQLRFMQCALSIALGERGTCQSGAGTASGDDTQPEVTTYVEFLKRWKYDSEQLSKSKQAVDALL